VGLSADTHIDNVKTNPNGARTLGVVAACIAALEFVRRQATAWRLACRRADARIAALRSNVATNPTDRMFDLPFLVRPDRLAWPSRFRREDSPFPSNVLWFRRVREERAGLARRPDRRRMSRRTAVFVFVDAFGFG